MKRRQFLKVSGATVVGVALTGTGITVSSPPELPRINLSQERYVKPGTYLYAFVIAEPGEKVPDGTPTPLPSPEEMKRIAMEEATGEFDHE